MYHSVGINEAFFTVTPENLRKQFLFLKKNYKITLLDDFIRKIKQKEDIRECVALTFDDGYLDNYKNVLPLVKELKIPITIFVPTELIGRELTTSDGVTLPIMNLEQLSEMVSTGLVSFMPHTENHVVLTQVTERKAFEEIKNSRINLENISKKTSNIFAYPKGKFNDNIVSYLKTNDWHGAVTVVEGVNTLSTDPFILKRNSIDSSTTSVQFKVKVSGAIHWYMYLKKILSL